jgi:hypothetical protein
MVVSRLYPDMNLSFGFTRRAGKVAYDVTSSISAVRDDHRHVAVSA